MNNLKLEYKIDRRTPVVVEEQARHTDMDPPYQK
jgi:hypothetical protein